MAADLTIPSDDTQNAQALLRKHLNEFETATGNKVTIVDMLSNSSDQFCAVSLMAGCRQYGHRPVPHRYCPGATIDAAIS